LTFINKFAITKNMGPNSQQGFNPNQNPFAGIINQSAGASRGGMPAGMTDPTDPSVPGQTGDSSKPLIIAIKSLHDYIAMSTDVRTQNMIRNLISMLNQLVSKEQDEAAKKGEEGQEGIELPMTPQV
jgi:hypothetical protein